MSQVPHHEHDVTNAPDMAPPLAIADFLERCMGNAAVAALVLDKLETQLRADIREIEERCGAQDAGQIARIAHALKGSAGAAAATTLHALAASVEGMARQDQLDAIAQEISGLRIEVERCLGYLPTARRVLESGAHSQPATELER